MCQFHRPNGGYFFCADFSKVAERLGMAVVSYYFLAVWGVDV